MSRDLNGYKRIKLTDITPGVRIFRRNNHNQFEDWGVVESLTDSVAVTDKLRAGRSLTGLSLWTHALVEQPAVQ